MSRREDLLALLGRWRWSETLTSGRMLRVRDSVEITHLLYTTKCGGRRSGVINEESEEESTTARSTVFSSSRTLPAQ